MRKSERLNNMMIYLSDKNFFNLKDIMDEYKISKSTAIRDIHSLEEIGMPIFSELGRHGRYKILNNKLLSPIIFTVDEMQALYFSMLTLKAYESTPFHLGVETLKKKFKGCLSEELLDDISKMEHTLSLERTKHYNSSPLLKIILEMAINDSVCLITYSKNNSTSKLHVQFFDISSSFAQWYATGFNYDTKHIQVFRCDRIIEISEVQNYLPKTRKELSDLSSNTFNREHATEFKIHVSEKGKDIFYKEHYPSMKLVVSDERNIIKGFYNKGEERFIADYFISYGNLIEAIHPDRLKIIIQKRLKELFQYYNEV